MDTANQGEFIQKAKAIILEHISNEQFGVSELAELMHMSRSNLLRKIKKQEQLSASRFIRQVRLEQGMALLTQSGLTVSEISFQVGFGNSSYFIKCFREYYGYPPGQVGKESTTLQEEKTSMGFFTLYRLIGGGILVIAVGLFWFLNTTQPSSPTTQENVTKSIAVLPFKNMSSDSSNLYFVNGLMESTLNNLQKIEDLRVISRTSVEKYRNTDRTIAEIAEELQVNYLVEGSGQRVGDQVLLNIQLIEAANDQSIWVEQYNHEVVDIFSLQNDVAKKIADAIAATVTPAELEQIDKQPTNNLVAYEYYLKALEPFNSRTKEGLEAAIPLFEKAIAEDDQFALVYSKIAISYYFLDLHLVEKQYGAIINENADKALLYDPKSAESLIAKALYYMHNNEFRLALPHLEKALEYNPNSSSVIQMLSNLYAYSIPNTAKYLHYALKGIQLDIAANDSTSKSFTYLQLSNALIQSGFTEEALRYINLSLDYNPNNYYSPYLKSMIQFVQHEDLSKTKRVLVREWKKDTTRMDLMQEVAKFYYYDEAYDSAFYYYQKFVSIKEKKGLYIYPQEDVKIGVVYEKMGLIREARGFYESYTAYCTNDESIYQPASMAMKYVHEGAHDLAIEQFQLFSANDNFQYWMLIFLEKDPMIKALQNHPEYAATMLKIQNRFWENQAQLKQSLEDKGLL